MTNAIVLLARILPAVASLPFEWFLEYFPLGFTSFDSGLGVIVLAVLALADTLVTSLSISKADAVHLLALTFGTSTLLSVLSRHGSDTSLGNIDRLLFLGRILGLEYLRYLLVHVDGCVGIHICGA